MGPLSKTELASAHLNSDRIGSTFQPPIAGADEAEAGGASGATNNLSGRHSPPDYEDEWAGLLGMVSPHSPLSPRPPLNSAPSGNDEAALWGGATSGNAGGAGAGSSTAGGGGGGGTFSDDDESVDAEPLWPTEANPAAAAAAAAVGLGGDRTPSPTEAQRLAAEGGALGASEERQDAARAAEARAAANAMFSQLSGSDAVGRPLTGTGYVSAANPLAPPASAKPAVFSLRPRSAATPKFSTGLNGTGHTPRGNADATGS